MLKKSQGVQVLPYIHNGMFNHDALLSPGVNPLEGSLMSSCGKLGPRGTLSTSNTKKG
jgi:hypothetical protein